MTVRPTETPTQPPLESAAAPNVPAATPDVPAATPDVPAATPDVPAATPYPEPAATPYPQPKLGAAPVSMPGDAGVLRRVRRRTAGAVTVPATCAAAMAVSGWVWPAWFSGWGGAVLGGLVVVLLLLAAGVLVRRAALWQQAQAQSEAWARAWDRAGGLVPELDDGLARDGWVTAVCGAAAPLHAGRGAIPMLRRERRFPSRVLPVRAASGPLAAGCAVVVHARVDGAMPARGDRIRLLALQPRGPILIGRLDDGAVFAAHRWTVGTG